MPSGPSIALLSVPQMSKISTLQIVAYVTVRISGVAQNYWHKNSLHSILRLIQRPFSQFEAQYYWIKTILVTCLWTC